MVSLHYEELCRYAIADQLKIPVESIQTLLLANPNHVGPSRFRKLYSYRHQIDLYWETGAALAPYLNIADCKWRSAFKVEQGDILKLQQVKSKVGAHKAMLISNAEFSSGALCAAEDEQIALLIVRPLLKDGRWPGSRDRTKVQGFLQAEGRAGTPLYALDVVQKGVGGCFGATHLPGGGGEAPMQPQRRVAFLPPSAPAAPPPSSPSGPPTGGGGGGYQTRQGPGPGFGPSEARGQCTSLARVHMEHHWIENPSYV
jgi:hypothetical protein